MNFPLKFAQFLAMAQGYNDAVEGYWKYRGDNELHMALRKDFHNKMYRYEGWLIGFLDGCGVEDYPQHQEIAMRVVLNAFQEEN